eukprot:1038612-Rhodomonas_salina.1
MFCPVPRSLTASAVPHSRDARYRSRTAHVSIIKITCVQAQNARGPFQSPRRQCAFPRSL